jgi:hypothetical protein
MIEKPRLLDRLRDRIRLKHYSIRTEKAYLDWNRRFILFHNKKHPRNMCTQEVEQFLTYLAVNGRVASSTQNQALSAILFMYKEVLKIELPWLSNVTRAKRPEKIPFTHGLTRSGGGSMFFLPESVRWTQGPIKSGGIILMNNHYSEQ